MHRHAKAARVGRWDDLEWQRAVFADEPVEPTSPNRLPRQTATAQLPYRHSLSQGLSSDDNAPGFWRQMANSVDVVVSPSQYSTSAVVPSTPIPLCDLREKEVTIPHCRLGCV